MFKQESILKQEQEVNCFRKGNFPTDTVNHAGGTAYKLSDKAALAQYAMTGCFDRTPHTTDQDQLKKTLELAGKTDPEFVAKLAVYARQKGLMKDMPAVLASVVAGKDSDLLGQIFGQVVDNPKMFVTSFRSFDLDLLDVSL